MPLNGFTRKSTPVGFRILSASSNVIKLIFTLILTVLSIIYFSKSIKVCNLPLTARCSIPIGLEDKRLRNGAMTASTYYNSNLAPWRGRINHYSSWGARRSTRTQWLQVYFGGLARITGISSQGRQNANQWVKTFVLTFSRDGFNFVKYPKVCLVKVLK